MRDTQACLVHPVQDTEASRFRRQTCTQSGYELPSGGSASLLLHPPWLSGTFGSEPSTRCLALARFPSSLLELTVIIMCG